MAASCSNFKRSRTELLASISKPTCSGRFASARKLRISAAGLLSSIIRKSFWLRSMMRLPCLSVTVNTTFTSLVPILIFGNSPASEPGSSEVWSGEFCTDGGEAWAGDEVCGEEWDDDVAPGAFPACAEPSPPAAVTSANNAQETVKVSGEKVFVNMPLIWLSLYPQPLWIRSREVERALAALARPEGCSTVLVFDLGYSTTFPKNSCNCCGNALLRAIVFPVRGWTNSSSAECRKFRGKLMTADLPRDCRGAPYTVSPTTGW